ncbi:glucuronoxylan 4-O-methyltransferase 3-like [Coffea eugenioides]|uniref:Glucuronoxylan 4-O-methyltransferase 3-like n=1 Tax=Coffea arabica TaxID=13443 RepID=A0A6P6UI71_COFAR|nr:glucuronoxylan 4-O-methyltransferase 3-like [Coffea arabica]XP_027150158.1 glucuronoxylan 4-O-methyltransferase 3-like [Coffea eugenioides]
MRSKAQNSINLKPLIILFSFFLFLLVLKLGSNFSSNIQNLQSKYIDFTAPCHKIPPSLAEALVHYASTNITPQQTYQELQITLRVLEQKSPTNFLIFGLGYDSLMWSMLNYGGKTIFLEESDAWMQDVKKQIPSIEAFHVTYNTKVTEAVQLLHLGKEENCKVVTDPRSSKCHLAIKTFPDEVYNTEWDVIMIDAPTGYKAELPGRMTAIYTAGLLARNKRFGDTDIFVHDIDRWVENKFSMDFLCDGYWKEEVGRIRHFTIPSHRGGVERPFCP